MFFQNLLVELSKNAPDFQRDWSIHRSGKDHIPDLVLPVHLLDAIIVVLEFECYLKIPNQESKNTSLNNVNIIDLNTLHVSKYYQTYRVFFSDDPDAVNSIHRINSEIETFKELHPEYNNTFDSKVFNLYVKDRYQNFVNFIHHFDLSSAYGSANDEGTLIYRTEHEPTINDRYESLTDDSKQKIIADKIKDHFNTSNVFIGRGGTKDPKNWYVEKDGSLKNHYHQYIPVEIVTPWTSGKDIISLVKKFKILFDEMEGITDTSTGFHVNIRFNHSNEMTNEDKFRNKYKIDFLKLILIISEGKDLHTFDRLSSTYAERYIPEIRRALRNTQDTNFSYIKSSISSDILKIFADEVKQLIQSKLQRKFQAINLIKFFKDNVGAEQGFIEFRIMGGDTLGSKYNIALDTIEKYMALVGVCSDQTTAYDSEYQIKLERLLQQVLLMKDLSYAVNADDFKTIKEFKLEDLLKFISFDDKNYSYNKDRVADIIILRLYDQFLELHMPLEKARNNTAFMDFIKKVLIILKANNLRVDDIGVVYDPESSVFDEVNIDNPEHMKEFFKFLIDVYYHHLSKPTFNVHSIDIDRLIQFDLDKLLEGIVTMSTLDVDLSKEITEHAIVTIIKSYGLFIKMNNKTEFYTDILPKIISAFNKAQVDIKMILSYCLTYDKSLPFKRFVSKIKTRLQQ